MCKSDYIEKTSMKKKKLMNTQDSSVRKSAVINDYCLTENDKLLLTINDELNLFTSFLSQSLFHHSIIIHCSSNNSHLMNLSFFLNQYF